MNQKKPSHGEILVEEPTRNGTFMKSSNSENLNSEVTRLSTFTLWPSQSAIDPSRLAKSGFYYTGKEDEVICFSCNGHIKSWQYGDIVQRKHMELFPDCDFVNNRSNNVPYISSKVNQHSPQIVQNGISHANKGSSDHISMNGHASETREQKSNHNDDKLKFQHNLRDLEGLKKPVFWRTKIEQESICKDMLSEEKRLQSFKVGWPLSFIDAAELAHAGFFYLGILDKVQCPYCKGIVSDWEVGDKPLEEHARHFVTCPFVIAATNIVASDKNKSSSWYKNKGVDICGTDEVLMHPSVPDRHKLLDKHQEHTKLEDLGVSLHKGPAHPQQATIAARLRSFVSWPSSAPVKKEDLANAGFFYIGISDHTKCFYCNGGLCSWEPGDDPWVEHARWFRNCNFVHLNQGDHFIKACTVKNDILSEIEAQTRDEPLSMNNASTSADSDNVILKTEEAMQSSMIKAVLETGVFPSFLVRNAIIKQIQERGTPFKNLDEVCEAVQFLQQENSYMNENDEEMDDLSPEDLSIKIQTLPSEETNTQETESSVAGKSGVSTEMSNATSSDQSKHWNSNSTKSLTDQRLCKICMDKEAEVVFLPCRHMLACTSCTSALKNCPLCREIIQATVTAYIP